MSQSMFRRFLSRITGTSSKPRAGMRHKRRLGIDALEERRLMSVNPALLGTTIAATDRTTVAELPQSVGSFSYNASTRAVHVQASDAHNDRVTISIDHRGTATVTDDMLLISIKNLDRPLTAQYKYTDVGRVFVNTLGGDDFIENKTIVKMTANGGLGRDVLIGGYGDDALRGGGNDDYLDGRRGNDTLWGEAGVDALFGDDGVDLLLGGTETDYLFGGNHDDTLYGELGNDRLYGEAGLDKLIDSGVNTLYQDYGPDYAVSGSGYTAYDWFDRNLKDGDLRSLARLHYRNGLLERNDMLAMYPRVASDNYISTNELADMKMLLSPRLNMGADVRFFMGKIANGDRANQWYHGGTLGNLAVGANGARLNALVDKWFKGGDLPVITRGRYEYVHGNLFVGGPNHFDVDQGDVGDCYFMAALGEVAFRSPSTIQRMFGSNGDGTFVVKFFKGSTPQFVTVNRMLPVSGLNRAVYAGWGSSGGAGNHFQDAGNELWVALAEKAYAQLNESGWIGQDGINSYAGIEGGRASNAFAHLTSKQGAAYGLSNSGIIAALQAGKAILINSKDSGVESHVVANHTYMLIGYDAGTQRFHLFNPHGFVGSNPNRFLTWAEITASFEQTISIML